MKMHKFFLTLVLFWAVGTSAPVWAQAAADASVASASSDPGSGIEMADAMRQDGKIYIVVAVLVTLLVGVLIYLINLDRKIGKLEKELRQ